MIGVSMRRSRGFSLTEALAGLAVAAILAAMAVPSVQAMTGRARCGAAARVLSQTFYELRWRSAAQGLAHGMLFDEDDAGWLWWVVRDGNGNGIRRAEVGAGTDSILSGPHRLEDRVSRVKLALPAGGVPRIPPGRGRLGGSHPVRFGSSRMVVFSPLGTSSSGTLYLTDGHDGPWAVRLYGRTTRISVWRFRPQTGRWTR